MNFLSVNDFNRADNDFINQPIQDYFIQFRDGGIFPDFSYEPPHIALGIIDNSQLVRDFLHPGLIVCLFLLQCFRHAEEPLLGQNTLGLVGI